LGEGAAKGRCCWRVGDLLRRQPAGPGGTTVRRFLTSRASALSGALHVLLHYPSNLAFMADNAEPPQRRVALNFRGGRCEPEQPGRRHAVGRAL
jgi:hypothetical protein